MAKSFRIGANWRQPKCPTVRRLAKPRIVYQLGFCFTVWQCLHEIMLKKKKKQNMDHRVPSDYNPIKIYLVF